MQPQPGPVQTARSIPCKTSSIAASMHVPSCVCVTWRMKPAGVEKEAPGHHGHGHEPEANGPGVSAEGTAVAGAARGADRTPDAPCNVSSTRRRSSGGPSVAVSSSASIVAAEACSVLTVATGLASRVAAWLSASLSPLKGLASGWACIACSTADVKAASGAMARRCRPCDKPVAS